MGIEEEDFHARDLADHLLDVRLDCLEDVHVVGSIESNSMEY